MKPWFSKFRISSAFDSGRPLPRWLRRRLSGSQELRSFARQISDLDQVLRRPAGKEAPCTLHSSIMGAVCALDRRRTAPPQTDWLRWLPAPALVGLALCVAWWWFSHPLPATQPVPSLASALETGEQLTETLPVQLMDPLNEEWRRVNLDLEKTTRFLLASVPFEP
jgi:hypothetical protein